MDAWDQRSPIYQQLADRLAAGLLDGDLAEGESMPSIRQLASRHLLNPLTVSKALQTLADAGLLEHRRGLGLYVRPGAQAQLRQRERERFLNNDWPQLRARLNRLGIGPADLSWTPR